jgi:hypothetical protein
MLGTELLPFALEMEPQSLDLLINGVGQSLTIG